jgi:hypothetical protein
MGLPTVSGIAAARVRRTEGDPKFCPTCTCYVGAAGVRDGIHRLTDTACPGSPRQHVIDSHPASVIADE